MEPQTLTEISTTHAKFVIERNYPASPERVFAAFADPAKKRRWFGEGKDFAADAYQLDFRVGGTEHSQFRVTAPTPVQGALITNDTVYQDIVPNRRIVFAYTMTINDHRMSASLATVELVPAGNGTQLIYTEQGAFFENSDGAKLREQGWTGLLEKLGREFAQ